MKKKNFIAKYVLAAVIELPIEASTLGEAVSEAIKLKTLDTSIILHGFNSVLCFEVRKKNKNE